MSGAFVTSELEGLDQVVTRLNAFANPRRTADGLGHIGGLVQSQTERRISEERTSPEGEAWAAWSPAYAESRKKGKTLLMASGGLLDSLAWDLTDEALQIGSNLVFAALHQFGGTDDMAPGPAAVPARPYLGVSGDNLVEIEDAMGAWIEGVLS